MNTRVPLVPQKDTRPEKKGAVVGVEEESTTLPGLKPIQHNTIIFINSSKKLF